MKFISNNYSYKIGKKEARKRLKPNSVPSQNLPKSSVILKSPKKRLPRNKKETLTIKQCQVSCTKIKFYSYYFQNWFYILLKHNVQSGDIELNIITPSLTEPPCLPIAIIENQVRLGELKFTFDLFKADYDFSIQTKIVIQYNLD